jgi:hypothetical protein
MSDNSSDKRREPIPPQAGLDMVAALVREPRRWSDWLSGHPDRSELFADIFGQATLLANATKWEMHTLLTELGCRVQTTAELGEMEEAVLRRCRDYFSLVRELAELLPETDERREIVSGAALLFYDSDGDFERCRESLKAGPFSATELIELGELDKAWSLSRLNLAGPVGDRARLLEEKNPFSKPRPHLSEERLDQYLAPAGILAPEMRARIRAHLELCPACCDAFHERQHLHAESLAPAV